MKYIVDIKGEIEGDYEIIGKYEERPQIYVFCENADEETLEDIKKELKKVLDKLKERNDE